MGRGVGACRRHVGVPSSWECMPLIYPYPYMLLLVAAGEAAWGGPWGARIALIIFKHWWGLGLRLALATLTRCRHCLATSTRRPPAARSPTSCPRAPGTLRRYVLAAANPCMRRAPR